MPMSKILKGAAVAVTAAAISVPAMADWAPQGPIKMMIAFAAGGGADTHGRMIAEHMQASQGWEIIPEQVTGKGGLNLANKLKDAPADGQTIGLLVTESLGYNLAASKAKFSTSDFAGLTTTAGFQMAVVAKTDKGWKSMEDALAAAKGGEQLRFGTMSPKLSDLAYLLGKANDVEFNIIQGKGGKSVMNGVNAGDMDLGFMAGIQAKGVKAGDYVELASAIGEPLNLTPSAKTLEDLGVPFNAAGYFAFIAPAGISEQARTAITDAIVAAITSEGSKANGFINKAFGGPAVIRGAELDALFAADNAAAGALLDAASE